MDEMKNAEDTGECSRPRVVRLETLVVGRSAAMRRVRERIAGLAPLRVPVLVAGESGTGRDSVVNAFHRLSAGADSPLVSIRAASAAAGKPPSSLRAVYLDEVGGLAADAQARWLARLREADLAPRSALMRLYASTSEDLAGRARDGSFDAELARRLLRFSVELPPLRDRVEDLRPLVDALLPAIGERLGRERVRVLPGALARLKRHPWAGNVRELAETLERLVAFSPNGEVTRAHVEEVLAASPESVRSLRVHRQLQQREDLIQLLRACGGNLAEVARHLDMSRGAIVYRARKYGLLPRAKAG